MDTAPTPRDEDGSVNPERIDWEKLADMVGRRIKALARCWVACRRDLDQDDLRAAERELMLPLLSLLLHFIECVREEKLSSPPMH